MNRNEATFMLSGQVTSVPHFCIRSKTLEYLLQLGRTFKQKGVYVDQVHGSMQIRAVMNTVDAV